MTTAIPRITEDRKGGLRRTIEMPGGGFRTFQTDEDVSAGVIVRHTAILSLTT